MKAIQDSALLLTAGGIETYLAFVQRYPLREFCAFEILDDEAELAKLEAGYLRPIIEAAQTHQHDLLLDTLLWRAQPDFMTALGYRDADLERITRLAIRRTRELVDGVVGRSADRVASDGGGAKAASIFIHGDLGPRGDGYKVDRAQTAQAAQRYHARQIEVLADAGVDAISALTMTNVSEAIGIARAADAAGLPCIVSPTIETDGRTPQGLALGEFIEQVEEATAGSPMFYMVNCAHPIHLEPVLRRARESGAAWLARFRGFRANASRKSHEELDNSTELDRGHPEALASQVAHLQADFNLRLVGGCCGTDAEHIQHIAASVAGSAHPEPARSAG